MNSANLRQELIEQFGDVLVKDDRLAEECINVCQIFKVSASDLFYKWEAYNYSNTRKNSSDFTFDAVLALKAQMQRSLSMQTGGKVNVTHKPFVSLHRRLGTSSAKVNLEEIDAKATSIDLLSTLESSRLTGNASPATRKVVVKRSDECTHRQNPDHALRYMYERISERSEVLDDRIDEMAVIFREHYNILDFGDPALLSENVITVIGSIVVNSDGQSSTVLKLTDGNVALQASRSMGSGAIVPLRFDPELKIRGNARGTGSISLFPGVVVVLRGKNGGGDWFLVTELLAPPTMEPSPTVFREELGSCGPFSMCIASGPYTSDLDLDYKNWQQLLRVIKSGQPDVILLIGPFVDATHHKFVDGDTDRSPTSVFKEEFLDQIHAYLDNFPGSTVILVPSVKDFITGHAVYPQCELGISFALSPRIHLMSNPCQFSINDKSFAVTSVDILFHLRKEELLLVGQEVDPTSVQEDLAEGSMINCCRHLLQQRSFYPMFPVPHDLSHDVNLDVSHSRLLRLGRSKHEATMFAPDFLILPSKLKKFSKKIKGTSVINSSFINKGNYCMLVNDGSSSEILKEQVHIDLLRVSLL